LRVGGIRLRGIPVAAAAAAAAAAALILLGVN